MKTEICVLRYGCIRCLNVSHAKWPILCVFTALKATTDEIPTMATFTMTPVLSSTNSTSDSSPINATSTATDGKDTFSTSNSKL